MSTEKYWCDTCQEEFDVPICPNCMSVLRLHLSEYWCPKCHRDIRDCTCDDDEEVCPKCGGPMDYDGEEYCIRCGYNKTIDDLKEDTE